MENLMDPDNVTLLHHINQAIKARGVMTRDVDYVVKDGQVIIVDEFTGRLMFGRRYNEGLHQAIEAKEGVKVERESKTLATITFQNYFRLYRKLSGMTGTAKTEETEFQQIYKLDVVEIPTNKPMIRNDLSDVIYKTERGSSAPSSTKSSSATSASSRCWSAPFRSRNPSTFPSCSSKGAFPTWCSTRSITTGKPEIVAQAGKIGAVTIATNMAGRGTDIKLGGNAEYLAKAEMRRLGFSEELIVESTGFGETDDEEILGARRTFQELEAKYKEEIRPEEGGGQGGRRPLYPGHRTARIPPDRQPAARPGRPSGGSGRIPVLSLAGGRPDAPVRR